MASVLAIYLVVPGVYDDVLRTRGAALPLLLAIVLWVGLLAIGIVHRWRWVFWILLVAFLASAIAIPVGALQLAGIVPGAIGPRWYGVLRLLISAVELGLGIWMVLVYRRTRRTWGQRRVSGRSP